MSKVKKELYTMYRAAHGLGKLEPGTSLCITEEDILGWAANTIKVAVEYYDAEVDNCLDPDCEVCESMQKLGYFLGGIVKRLPGKYTQHSTWVRCRDKRYKDLRIGHDLTCTCAICTSIEERKECA